MEMCVIDILIKRLNYFLEDTDGELPVKSFYMVSDYSELSYLVLFFSYTRRQFQSSAVSTRQRRIILRLLLTYFVLLFFFLFIHHTNFCITISLYLYGIRIPLTDLR